MVRDYKKDFCKENKESALLSENFKKKITPSIVFQALHLVFLIIFLAKVNKPGNNTWLFLPLTVLPLVVLILDVKLSKAKNLLSKRAKAILKIENIISIIQFPLMFVSGALFVFAKFRGPNSDLFALLMGIFNLLKNLFLITGITIFVFLIILSVSNSKAINRMEYFKSLNELNKQCNYLKESQTYKMVADLLKADDFEAASNEANALQNKYVEQRKIDIENSHKFVEKMNLQTESEFDGKTIQYIGWNILGTLVTVVTFGILYPVSLAWVEGWKINHRTINGKRLRFDGNGFQLLGRYILWWLLCIVTIGIYALFLPKKIQQWVTKHTHFVNLEDETEENRKLLEQNGIVAESKFEGRNLAYIGWQILGFLVTLLTLGILYPVRLAWIKRWEINGQNINGLQMRFDGHGFQLLGKYILWWLLSIVTFGIFLLFLPVRIEKWVTKHTHFEKVIADEEI